MIIRGITEDGDWQFGLGANSYKTKQDALMQNIATKLREWFGDCFFEAQAGIDWINRIGKISPDLLQQELLSKILQCEGVTDASVTNAIYKDRVFTVQYSVTTIYSSSSQALLTVQV